MTDETTKVEETTEEAVEETTEEAPASEQKEEVKEESTTSQDIDYKAELEAELAAKDKQINQAEYTIKKLKKDRKEPKEENDDYTDAQTLGAKEVREIIREENQVFYNKTRESDLKRKIREQSGSQAEADLVLHHFSNSIRVTGDDDKDIANARLLANGKRYRAELLERDRANRTTVNKITEVGAGQRVNTNEGDIRLTPEEEKLASRIDPDGTKGTAKKMLTAKMEEMS